MADVQHSTLTGVEVHEPKDIATGADGQVYTADGIGSGTWADQAGRDTNALVHVTDFTDFPAPVAGVITLAPDTTYLIDGSISLAGNRLVLNQQTGIVGHNGLLDQLLYTGVDSMITSTQSFIIKDVRLDCTSSFSTLFSVSGTGNETAVVSRVAVTFVGDIGTFISRGVTTFDTFAVIDSASGGVIFSGAHSKLSVINSFFFNWSNILFDLNGATFNNVIFGAGNQFDVSLGDTAIAGLISGGNINVGGGGVITGNIFTGAGTYLSGISTKDPEWISDNNRGIPDSHVIAANFLTGGPTTTALTTGVAVKIMGSTILAPDTERFDDDGGIDNRLRYTGIEDKTCMVFGVVTGQSSGGSAITCDIVIKSFPSGSENDVVVGIEFPTSTDASFSFQFPAVFETGDSKELWIRRTSGSQDLDTTSFEMSTLGA